MPKRRRRSRQHNSHPVAATWIFVMILLVLGGGMLLRGRLKTEMQSGAVTQTSSSTSSNESIAQQRFIKKMAAPAVRVYQQNGQVLPSIVIAQAILESSWGTSELFLQANNPFGVKGQYQGQSKTFPTTEYVNNKKITVRASFRDYPTLTDAILDHDALLKQSYFRGRVTDYRTAAKLLQSNGYATDPHYARKLMNVIATYNLNDYDT